MRPIGRIHRRGRPREPQRRPSRQTRGRRRRGVPTPRDALPLGPERCDLGRAQRRRREEVHVTLEHRIHRPRVPTIIRVAVNLDRDRAKADEFLATDRGQLNILYDPKGDIARQFNFKDMPTAILIGRDGKARFVHSGFEIGKENAYLADVVSLLHQKAP